MRSSRLIAAVTILILLLAAVRNERGRFSGTQPSDDAIDFASYYVAATLARQGRSLYPIPPELLERRASIRMLHGAADSGSPTAITAHALGLTAPEHDSAQYFSYPPFAILIFEPFTRLEFRNALLLWRGLSLLLLIASIYLTLLLARAQPFLPIFSASVIAGVSFFPFLRTVELGQVSTLILFLWVLGIYLQDRGHPAASALSFAVGTLVKITPAVAVGVFLIRRQWKWLAAYAAWMLILLGISIAHSGWHDNYMYFTQVFPSMSCGTPGVASKSLPSLIESVFYRDVFLSPMSSGVAEAPPWLCWLAKSASGALLAGFLWLIWKLRMSLDRAADRLREDLILMALVSLLAAPVAWRHSYVLAILPILYFWVRSKSSLQQVVLVATTLIIGTGLLEDAVFRVQSHAAQLALSAMWVLASVGLLAVGIWGYRETVDTQRPREK